MSDYGSNKHNYGANATIDTPTSVSDISIAKVVSIDDSCDGNRIKVRIKGVDDKILDNDLPFAFPLLPKFINIVPAVGESVFLFLLNHDNKHDNRMWLGPIISQPQKLNYDPHLFTSNSLLSGGLTGPEQAPTTLPNAKGIYPSKENIALQGRDNSDLIFKSNEVILRAGKFVVNNNLEFNKKNIAYIQIKSNVIIDSNNTKGTVTNIVSDKINLLTYTGLPTFVLNDQTDMITDAELQKILSNTQSLVYGEKLLDFITLVKRFIVSHTHPYANLPTVQDPIVKSILQFDLNTLLSKNIRIN
jgi:hypothetical protein